MTVRWSRPAITGRDDFYYMLRYSDFKSVESFQIVNKDPVVLQLITDLEAFTDYTIIVTVLNGVSDQDPENEITTACVIDTKTLEGGT